MKLNSFSASSRSSPSSDSCKRSCHLSSGSPKTDSDVAFLVSFSTLVVVQVDLISVANTGMTPERSITALKASVHVS